MPSWLLLRKVVYYLFFLSNKLSFMATHSYLDTWHRYGSARSDSVRRTIIEELRARGDRGHVYHAMLRGKEAIDLALKTGAVENIDDFRQLWHACHTLAVSEMQQRTTVRGNAANVMGAGTTGSTINLLCSDGRLRPDVLSHTGVGVLRDVVTAIPGTVLLPGPVRDELIKIASRGHRVRDYLLQHKREFSGVHQDFERWWGSTVKSATRDNTVTINVISHFDGHDEDSGCGAHSCDSQKAKLETACTAAVISRWLDSNYQLVRGQVQVTRSAYDTNGGYSPRLWHAKEADGRFHCRTIVEQIFTTPNHTLPLSTYAGSPFHTDIRHHKEAGIRISDTPQLHTLAGMSLFNLAWRNNPDQVFSDVLLLLSLMKKFFLHNHPGHDAFIHIDIPAGDKIIEKVALVVMQRLRTEERVKDMLGKSAIVIFTTKTHARTGESEEMDLDGAQKRYRARVT